MAEVAIVSTVLGVLREIGGRGLGEGFGLIQGVDWQLEKLQSNFSAIEAVLADADEQRLKNRSLDDWLKKVRDVAYQADNVLEEFRMEALRREVETGNHMFKKVRDFFSGSNQLIFKFRMGRKLKEVGVRLDIVAKEKQDFHLNERIVGPLAGAGMADRETFSFIEDTVYGRVEDREKIVKFLMAPNDEDVISVISIVGMGGIGKTTLAKLAFNDPVVESTFATRIWVCVSEDFNVARLIRMMIESTTGAESMERLQSHLREKLNGKKLLLVLDDVWNEDSQKWLTLRGILQICAEGSKIIVTTRSENIATIMGSVYSHILEALTEDECRNLFEKTAFHGRRKEECPKLVSIGQEMVKKCNGIPLAAKALGSLMGSKKTESDWMAIKNSEIWQLRDYNILPALMLSYYNLLPCLKPCFVYCALFPKDSCIEEKKLIWLWMVEGLIPSHSLRSPQDIGKEYLRELVSSSLFQSDGYNFYYVHDLVHDLAKYITGDACSIVQAGGPINVPQFCHCLTLICDQNIIASPKEFCRNKTLRTLLFLRNWGINEVPREMFVSLSKLRALDFSHFPIGELPDSISNLKLLKYINLSYTGIKVVPQSICSLQNLHILVLHMTNITSLPASLCGLLNLQVLVLSHCTKLQSLPSSIGDLQNLNALPLDHCLSLQMLPESVTRLQKLDSLELSTCCSLQELPTGLSNMTNLRRIKLPHFNTWTHMPTEMGKLNRLQELSTFIVNEERGCSIAELQHLKDLGGELKILNLGKLKDPRVAMEANLKEKQNIRSLYLLKGEDELVDDVAMEVLEGLEPSQNIMELHMKGGTQLPGWLKLNMMESSFPNLVRLVLCNFRGCKHLPPLGLLQSLETLDIYGMSSIEVVGREFCGSNGGVAFPSLKRIHFGGMAKWKTWLSSEEDENIGQQAVVFTRLTELGIHICPELTSMPRLPCLTKLHITGCPGLTSLPHLPCLTKLSIYGCPEITSLPCLPSLQKLMPHLPCLTELHITGCPGLTLLPHLPCLTKLIIHGCPEITSLPCLPSLQELSVDAAMKLLKSAGSLRELGVESLKTLEIYGKLGEDVGVMEGLRHVSNVEELVFRKFDELDCVMESMRHLFSTVQKLTIWGTEEMRVLPETIGSLVSLQCLSIYDGHKITSLGQVLRGLTALWKLTIYDCQDLGSMPEYMGSLTSLQFLIIDGCPHLQRRCKREKGEDWHLISHIPHIYIDPYINEEEDNPRLKKKAISVVKERISACFPSTSST